MPAKHAMGINFANGDNTSIIISNTKAWTIPAIGVRPPLLTLVAVLAMAPVAGIQPNIDEKQFAIPWPTNSTLERWRQPIIPSLTTADKSDSIPPDSEIAKEV